MSSPSTPKVKTTQSSSARKKITPYSRKASDKTATQQVKKDNTAPKIPKGDELPDLVPMDDKPSPHPAPAAQPTDSNAPKHDKELGHKDGFNADSSDHASHPHPSNSDEDKDSEVSLGESDEEIPITKQSDIERTVRCINFFRDAQHDKNHVPLPCVRLKPDTKEHINFSHWRINVEFKLRMRQVWCLVEGFGGKSLVPLEEDHELYMWYERMVDVALSLIYASVSPEIRKTGCFMKSILDRDVEDMMWHLYAHYGVDPEETDD